MCNKRCFTGPCGGGNPPPYSLTGVFSHAIDGGSPHSLMGSGGDDVTAVSMSYFLLARSDEMFGVDSGAVHSAHSLTRGGGVVYADGTQLECMRLWQADRVEVRFKGHTGDQEQIGSVRVRTRNEVRRSKSSFRVDGGAVALMLELMSCFSSLPDHAPLSSCRCGNSEKSSPQ